MRSAARVTFEAGEGPRLEPLDDAAKLNALSDTADDKVFAPVYEAVRQGEARAAAERHAARLLRRAVDGRDLHDRGTRHAGSGACAADGLSRAAGLRPHDRHSGQRLVALPGRATARRRGRGADFRHLGGRAAACRVRALVHRADAADRRERARRNSRREDHRLSARRRRIARELHRRRAGQCREHRLDRRAGLHPRAHPEQGRRAGQPRSAGAARGRRGARPRRGRHPARTTPRVRSSSISATASCRKRRSRTSSRRCAASGTDSRSGLPSTASLAALSPAHRPSTGVSSCPIYGQAMPMGSSAGADER